MAYRLTEATLEQELASILSQELAGSVITQPRLSGSRQQPDIILDVKEYRVVIECKIGKPGLLTDAILQVSEYQEGAGADGSMVFLFPSKVREFVLDQSQVNKIVRSTPLFFFCLTPFLRDHKREVLLADVLKELSSALALPQKAPSLALVVKALADSVSALGAVLRRHRQVGQFMEPVVSSFELFSILSEPKGTVKDPEVSRELQSAVCDLACYILVNQLLLYRLLAEKLSLPPIREINRPEDLSAAFRRIRKVDYRAVYEVRVAEQLPASALDEVNKIIRLLQQIEPELVQHDLLGRVFHEFLPFETRKNLGAFYTKPVAAEILAQIAIDRDAKRIIDPASGSGTLLVAAYRRLKELNPSLSHRELVENLLTAADVMPFASHMTALNLTLQSPDDTTDRTRVGLGNSLALTERSRVGVFGRTGLFDYEDTLEAVDQDAIVAGHEFALDPPFDGVIMNPPFTRKERLTLDMLGIRAQVFPRPQNYWAYFLSLADSLLREGGTIAAVLPRDFIRGEPSRAVREWVFRKANYSLMYIVKSLSEVAFSEHASFRDYLFVLKKGNCQYCGVVYLKRSLTAMDIEVSKQVGQEIASVPSGVSVDREDFAVDWISQEVVYKSSTDLWPLVAFSSPSNSKAVTEFLGQSILSRPDMVRLRDLGGGAITRVTRGMEPHPRGVYDALFVVRPICEERLGRARLVLTDEMKDHLIAECRVDGSRIRIPRECVVPALRTHSYVTFLSLDNTHDYLITKSFKAFKRVHKMILGEPIDFEYIRKAWHDRGATLFVLKRFDFAAPGVSAISIHSTSDLTTTNTIHSIRCRDDWFSKGLCLWFNSIVSILQALTRRTETRGSYCDFVQSELLEFRVPTPQSPVSKALSDAWDSFSDVSFPSILEQVSTHHPQRVDLDLLVLTVMGFTQSQAKQLIAEFYRIIAEELTQMREAMGTGRG